jgi:hypothetical protein
MSFLTNDGNLLVDMVLTDTGRQRLSRGDGSFKPTKFAFSDDEIDYGLYDKTDSRGLAYYDEQVLLTPILEAFTNNAIAQKHRLITIPKNNLLYLPTTVLNTITNPQCSSYGISGIFVVATDDDSEDEYCVTSAGAGVEGVLYGETAKKGPIVRVDQGLDTTELSPEFSLDSDLVETQYQVQIDNRFGEIVSPVSGKAADVSYIDDDNIASYTLTMGDTEFVEANPVRSVSPTEVIDGPRGTVLKFRIKASINLNSNTYLFTQLGSTASWTGRTGAHTIYYLDTNIRVTGGTTGNSLEIPVRFIKLQ